MRFALTLDRLRSISNNRKKINQLVNGLVNKLTFITKSKKLLSVYVKPSSILLRIERKISNCILHYFEEYHLYLNQNLTIFFGHEMRASEAIVQQSPTSNLHVVSGGNSRNTG